VALPRSADSWTGRYGRVGGRVGQKLARHRLGEWRKTPTSRGVVVGGPERDRTADLLIAKVDAIEVARRQ
jgi:hypothetical protein